jgi:putative PIN family toxin of toxin-antitoxin system
MMLRVVVDTNVLVSATLLPTGRVGVVLLYLRQSKFTPLYCMEMLEELISVLARPRIQNKYHISDSDIRALVDLILLMGEHVEPVNRLAICRDPKDDVFLSVAAAGEADYIVTGDDDLLSLNPFRGIPIVTPAEFIRVMEQA